MPWNKDVLEWFTSGRNEPYETVHQKTLFSFGCVTTCALYNSHSFIYLSFSRL